MRKVALITLGVIGGLVLLFVIVVAMQPGEFRLARSTTIKAPPEVVFRQVNDFHRWENWSPWAKLDPAMKVTFTGADSGQGAVYSWVGNQEVGEGRITIVESKPEELVRLKLEFLKPFTATNTADFTFKPAGDQTEVTWSMYGECSFVMKAFHLFMDMDAIVGKDFEKGLADMKKMAESAATADASSARSDATAKSESAPPADDHPEKDQGDK